MSADLTADNQHGSLPLGVASGDVGPNSAVVWTRATAAGEVRFEYSTDPAFGELTGSSEVLAANATVPVKVELSGLTPGTQYYFRAVDAEGNSAGGRFRTPHVLGTQNGLRFGASGDWRGDLGPYPAVFNVPERDLDLFIAMGDTIYADVGSPAVPNKIATTLDEFRAKHAEVYSTHHGMNTLGDLRASAPIFGTIDDHEVVNNFAAGAPTSSDPRFWPSDAARINDTQRFEDALQAFQEFNPLRDEFYGATGDPRTAEERKLYRYQTYGSDAAVFVLDARSFRDMQLPHVENPLDAEEVAAYLDATYDPSRTMLGAVQLADLKRDLLAAHESGVAWKFIAIPEPIQNIGVVKGPDRFEGYAAERTEVLRFIKQHNILNVVFVAADLHGTLVNNLSYQESPTEPHVPLRAFEVTTGSVAYDAPFGYVEVNKAVSLGLITAEERQDYFPLPVQPDADDLPDDKDDFVKALLNDHMAPLGYDPIGLEGSGVNARLLEGDYAGTDLYTWTEFDVAADSGLLTVTTYGIAPYGRNHLATSLEEILARRPTVVSKFEVAPIPQFDGDADADGDVDLADFLALKSNFGSGTLPFQGDFSGDQRVDLQDFLILKNNFGQGVEADPAAARAQAGVTAKSRDAELAPALVDEAMAALSLQFVAPTIPAAAAEGSGREQPQEWEHSVPAIATALADEVISAGRLSASRLGEHRGELRDAADSLAAAWSDLSELLDRELDQLELSSLAAAGSLATGP